MVRIDRLALSLGPACLGIFAAAQLGATARAQAPVSPRAQAPLSLRATGSPPGPRTLARDLDAGVPGPRLRTPDGPPILGRPFALRVEAGAHGARGWLLFGLDEDPIVLANFGATLYPASPGVFQWFTLDAQGTSPRLFTSAALPPLLAGRQATAQAAVFDPAAAGGLTFTNAIRMRVGTIPGPPLQGAGTNFGWTVEDLASGDMNGDGELDLVAVGNGLSVALGQGDGSFEISDTHGAIFVGPPTVGDFDGDGALDVSITNGSAFSPGTLRIQLGNGDGTVAPTQLSAPAGTNPYRSVAADLDNDGRTDLVTPNLQSEDLVVHAGWGNGGWQSPTFYALPDQPGELVVADFDADGALDLAVGTGPELSILMGAGDATFAAPTTTSLQGFAGDLAAADLDGDGTLDLVVVDRISSSTSEMVTLLGLGDGTFEPGPRFSVTPSGTGSTSVGAGSLSLQDVSGDGVVDLAFGTTSFGFGTAISYQFRVAAGLGDGSFAAAERFELPGGLVDAFLADVDGDARLDLVGGHLLSCMVAVYRGLDGARFSRVTRITGQRFPISLASADFNGDGAPDLAIPSLFMTRVSIHLGDGSGSFQYAGDVGSGDEPRRLAVGDVNGDGHPDLAVPDRFGVGIMLGDGAGGFGLRHAYPVDGDTAESTSIGDLDGDGVVDLVLARPQRDDLAVLLGTGAGTFGPETTVPTGDAPERALLVDVDQDGDLDLAVALSLGSSVAIHLGAGDGTFSGASLFPLTGAPNSLVTGDFDRDGIPDLAAPIRSRDQLAVLLGFGNGSFGPPTYFASGNEPTELQTGDLDGDGILDLLSGGFLTLNGGCERALAYHRGRGDGSFESRRSFPAPNMADLLLEDFDLDGMLDVATLDPGSSSAFSFDGTVTVLLNPIGE